MMSDPETLKNFEEASGLKIMTIKEYDAIDEEVRHYQEIIVDKRERLDQKMKEEEEHKKELDPLREEMKELESKLGLDKYCGSCKWKGNTSCDARVAYVKDKHKTPETLAKKELMDNKQCTNP